MYRYKVYILMAILMGVLIIGATLFMSMIVKNQLEKNLITNYIEQEKIIARNTALSLESELSSIKNQLLLMGDNNIIKIGSSGECTAEIKKQLSIIGSSLGNVGRVNIDGIFKCSLNPKLLNTEASNLGSYIDDIFSDPQHEPVMSRAITVPGINGYAVALHVPVWKDNNFNGTIGGAVYLSEIENKYLKDVVFAKRGFVSLMDSDGTMLYHKNRSLIGKSINSTEFNQSVGDSKPHEDILSNTAKGKSGVIRYINILEGEKIAVYEPVQVLENRTWTVLVTMPISDVKSDLGGIEVHKLLLVLSLFITLIIILAVTTFIIICNKLIFKPIKEIQEMKSDFVSLVSHQLKTPVAQIKGYTENMLEGLTGELNSKQKEYLSDMLKVANKNSQLIDDLLNVSRIERKLLKVNIEPLDVNTLLTDTLEPLKAVAKSKGVVLEEKLIQKSVSISGDPVKTREALRNIIDNAIKFTDTGKKVFIITEDGISHVTVKIKDEGIGIDKDVEHELFEKNRVWAGKVKASGAGLGLYLSKQFIELTGGIITFRTEKGKGTEFTIKLPKIK